MRELDERCRRGPRQELLAELDDPDGLATVPEPTAEVPLPLLIPAPEPEKPLFSSPASATAPPRAARHYRISRNPQDRLNVFLERLTLDQEREVIAATPMGKFMLETDSPFLAPVPYRGKRCEPAYVADTARAMAALRGETMEQVAADTTRNALAFFRGWD